MPIPSTLEITAATVDPALLDLPWDLPLEDWPTEILAALPRGISRHVVRFVNLSDRVIAVKEIGESVAYKEYELLRDLSRMGAPSVIPTAVVSGRRDAFGEELAAVLVTEHLQFSLPYRAVFSQHMSPDTAGRLIDALAVLLVRLHLLGFYWGDVSLSNTLFRRDAGSFSAYLVDAETGEIHPSLTEGPEVIETNQKWRVAQRIRRLNNLGFEVGELQMSSDLDGTHMIITPKVVDAGHHHRKLMRLTGMDVGENQAQRMLNDIETYRAMTGKNKIPLEIVAHEWMNEVFEPVISAVPAEFAAKLEPAQIFHEFLEHRWYLAEEAGRDIPQDEAIESYVKSILPTKRDEAMLLDPALMAQPDEGAASEMETLTEEEGFSRQEERAGIDGMHGKADETEENPDRPKMQFVPGIGLIPVDDYF